MDRLHAMRLFVRVIDAGSLSAAARQLNLGQPAVSKALASLEDQLGVRLLVRTTRAHSLTEAGQRFYERARIVLDAADEADAAARNEAAALSGRLRISAPPLYASLQIIPRLGAFMGRYPELCVDMVLDDRHIDLIEEGVDLAIRAGDLGDSALVARRIDRAPRLIVGAPAYLERRGAPAHPAELWDYDIITYTGYQPATWRFSREETATTIDVAGTLRVSAAEGLRAAVLAGLGLAMVSTRMVEAELASGAVRPVLETWILPPVEVWAIYPAGRRPPARARLFVDWLATALRDADKPDAETTRRDPGSLDSVRP